jgi:hypothetical protein
MYGSEMYGTGSDGKPATDCIGSPFETIDAAAAIRGRQPVIAYAMSARLSFSKALFFDATAKKPANGGLGLPMSNRTLHTQLFVTDQFRRPSRPMSTLINTAPAIAPRGLRRAMLSSSVATVFACSLAADVISAPLPA